MYRSRFNRCFCLLDLKLRDADGDNFRSLSLGKSRPKADVPKSWYCVVKVYNYAYLIFFTLTVFSMLVYLL